MYIFWHAIFLWDMIVIYKLIVDIYTSVVCHVCGFNSFGFSCLYFLHSRDVCKHIHGHQYTTSFQSV